MKKIFLVMAMSVAAFSLSAQGELERILTEVEANNASLAALRKLRDAQTVGARVGNSLENPEVEFSYKWNDPSSLGTTGEISVSQPFDFPTVYAHRNKLAKLQAEKYGYEYQASRQELLLEAQKLYIEIVSLKRTTSVLEFLADNAREIAKVYAEKLDVGDANILESNEANFTLISQDNALKMARVQLQSATERLTGLNGGIEVKIDADDFGELPILGLLDEILAEYMELSPELRALAVEKMAAERDIKLSRSLSLPKLSVGYSHEFSKEDKSNGLSVGMSIPMFGNRNNVKRAKAQDEYAAASLKSATLDVETGIREQYAQAQIIRESLVKYESMLDLEQAVEFARKALDAGRISITEYFSQVQPIYEAHLTIMELQRDYLLAFAQINSIRL